MILDRESLQSDVIDLILRATDEGDHQSEAFVKVTVTDINDNSPHFVLRHNRPEIVPESVSAGHVITNVTAFDPDQGLNGEISYRIESGSFGKFVIHPKTGRSVTELFIVLIFHFF